MRYYLDIPYDFPGNVRRTFDLIVPDQSNEKPPLLVWIHGGGWSEGDKRIHNEFERFCYHGYAILSIDYRFSSDAPFPAQLIDCKAAIRWARANAEKYGYCTRKIIVGGNSAGGHLAMMLALTNQSSDFDQGDNLGYSSAIDGVLDLYGPTDLSALPTLTSALEPLLQRNTELTSLASPINHVSADAPPTFIIHGQQDPIVPVEQSRVLYEALKKAGAPVIYHEVPNAGHGFDDAKANELITDFISSIHQQ